MSRKETQEGFRPPKSDAKDLVEKDFMAFPDVAADVVNALLYNGEQIVSATELLSAPTETLYHGNSDKKLRNQYEDLAKYEMREGQIQTMYLFANQTVPDSRMILRKAGYMGGAYREQYEEKISSSCPVIELVLYWGEGHWHGARSIRQLFSGRRLPPKAWQYIDDIQLHVWEMRYLPQEVRERFGSDMRIVLDYLAEGDSYRSDRPVVHKGALIRMIRALSGDCDVEDIAEQLEELSIKEEDEITVCELFEQYERKGRSEGIGQGIRILIWTCKDMKLSFGETAERVKKGFQLDDAELQKNMELYWPE